MGGNTESGGDAGSLEGFERTTVRLLARGVARQAADHALAGGCGGTAAELEDIRGTCRRLREAADERAGEPVDPLLATPPVRGAALRAAWLRSVLFVLDGIHTRAAWLRSTV